MLIGSWAIIYFMSKASNLYLSFSFSRSNFSCTSRFFRFSFGSLSEICVHEIEHSIWIEWFVHGWNFVHVCYFSSWLCHLWPTIAWLHWCVLCELDGIVNKCVMFISCRYVWQSACQGMVWRKSAERAAVCNTECHAGWLCHRNTNRQILSWVCTSLLAPKPM